MATDGSAITRRRFLAGTGVILTGPAFLASCGTTRADRSEAQPPNTTRIHFRQVDAQSGQTTPAMACISNATSTEVRLPPDGRVCARPSYVQQFVTGFKFDPDPNWIGPVRKMQGKGDNNDRSFVYEDRPSIPYWKEPVIYLTSGDFALVSGQEDPRSTFGHIIGLNLQATVRDTTTYDFYDITFRGIHAQTDALVGFAHFAWNGCDLPRGFPWFLTTGEIDFIEVLQFGLINRLDYEHPVETSQWLMADVACDNNAVAHTTPIYVVVNGQPT